MTEDVVVYLWNETAGDLPTVGRHNVEVATRFCRRPWWPFKRSEHFVGVDEWGSGTIVCATPSLSNWVGKSFAEFRRAVRL